jgi:hypothetical protein
MQQFNVTKKNDVNVILVPKPIQDPADLPQAVRRESTTTEISPQNLAALQQRRGSQVCR